MIYTVTFNPALDYVVFLDDLKLGDVNRSTRESIFYGGKGINVSTILNTLGLETTALGFVAGFTGKAIEDGLAAQGIHTDFIHLAVGKGLHLPEYVLSDVMCDSGGNPGAAIAKKNRSADTNKRDDGRQRSHLHQKSSVLVHHTLIDHIGNDRRNPQLDQCKSKDRNHV